MPDKTDPRIDTMLSSIGSLVVEQLKAHREGIAAILEKETAITISMGAKLDFTIEPASLDVKIGYTSKFGDCRHAEFYDPRQPQLPMDSAPCEDPTDEEHQQEPTQGEEEPVTA